MSKPLNIVMIGPKSCGKTSILSVMLTDIQNFITRMTAANPVFFDQSIQPSLEPKGMAHGELAGAHKKLQDLVQAARKSSGAVQDVNVAIMGDLTARVTPVVFRIGKFETLLNFHDFPGGFYSQVQIDRNRDKGYSSWSKEDIEQWENIIKNADIIMLAIDATVQAGEKPLLLDGSYYSRITKLVKDSIQTSMTTLIFVPVKCEHIALKYEYDNIADAIEMDFSQEGCAQLKKDVERLFPELLSFVRTPEEWVNVDAFFAPMITIGGIKCSGSKYDPQKLRGVASFVPAMHNYYEATPFLPMNCDKIFAMCLLRAYEPMQNEWLSNRTIWDKICGFFTGSESPFSVFFDRLAESINFKKMFGCYFANNKKNWTEFLTKHYAEDEETLNNCKNLFEEFAKWSIKGSEDGCCALNLVWWPGSRSADN